MEKKALAIMILAANIALTACSADRGQTATNDTSEQTQAAIQSQANSESTVPQSVPTEEVQNEAGAESAAAISMPILDEIDQDV